MASVLLCLVIVCACLIDDWWTVAVASANSSGRSAEFREWAPRSSGRAKRSSWGNDSDSSNSSLRELVKYVYFKREERGSPFSDLLLHDKNGTWYVYDKRAVAHKLMYRDGSPLNASSYYARAENKHWFKFKNPPQKFKDYFLSLPKLVKSYDNERLILAHDGSEWLIFSKITGDPVKLDIRDTNVKYPTMYRVRATDYEWYTFVNPTVPFRKWLESLPPGRIKHEVPETWDNDKLLCIDEEDWRINDTGRVRRIIAQGSRRFNARHIYCVRCDNDWYKLKNPPPGFVKYISFIPVFVQQRVRSKREAAQQQGADSDDHQHASTNDCTLRYIEYCKQRSLNMSTITRAEQIEDHLLCRGKRLWYVRNKVGRLMRLMWQTNRVNQSRYRYARDEDGAWHKFHRLPDEFIAYLESLPISHKYSDEHLLVPPNDGRGWLVRSRTDNQERQLVEKNAREKLTNGNVMIQAKDEHGIWYSFINPPEDLRKSMQQLPTTDKSIMIWDNQRLLVSELGNLWKLKDDQGNLRTLVMRGQMYCSASDVHYVKGDDERWYKFKFPPKQFVAFILQLPTNRADTLLEAARQS